MTDLIAGPYHPPAVRRGDWTDDLVSGRVQVGGWTDALIPWPRRMKSGRPSLVVTGELARAVRTEAVETVVEHWGVSPVTVWAWRKALGVDRMTEGTRGAMSRAGAGRTDDGLARAQRAAKSPEAVAKMAHARRGQPASEATRQALLAAAKRPKPQGWGQRASEWMRAGRKSGEDGS